jgi:hypothetical protein
MERNSVDGCVAEFVRKAFLRLRRGRPMPEGDKSDFLHAGNLLMRVAFAILDVQDLLWSIARAATWLLSITMTRRISGQPYSRRSTSASP